MSRLGGGVTLHNGTQIRVLWAAFAILELHLGMSASSGPGKTLDKSYGLEL